MRNTEQFALDYNEVASRDGRDGTWPADRPARDQKIAPREILVPEADLSKLYRLWHPSDRDDGWTKGLTTPPQQMGEGRQESTIGSISMIPPEEWLVQQESAGEGSARIRFSISARLSTHVIEPEFTVIFDQETASPGHVTLSVLNVARLEEYVAPLIEAKRNASAALGDSLSRERELEIREANKPAFYETYEGDDINRLFSKVVKKLPSIPALKPLKGESQ